MKGWAPPSAHRLGTLVAASLVGAWRRETPDPELSAEQLTAAAPLLLRSGAGALAWRRVRHSALRACPAALELQQAHRLHVVQTALREREIRIAVTVLRAAGIEPLLIKGWAIARLYPEKGLRPYGDIDLCVRPDQFTSAKTALWRQARGCRVDLHEGLAGFAGESLAEVMERAHAARLGEVEVRVPAPEDHLRILCVHLLRHGAWRPLWLCDVALALEDRSADFDWNLCLGADRRKADWVACAIGVAHRLLDARVADTPVERRATHLPRWLVASTLEQWERRTQYRLPMRAFVRHPLVALREMRFHWPNGIEATVGVRGPFNNLPRLPFQLADGISRAARFLARRPRAVPS